MIEKFKGIILTVADYKDADKLATIFSLEHGVLNAKFSGVKKEKAKYKAVAQPFVLANFVVAEKGRSLTVTQADIIDSFPNILKNYSKTICAYLVLDMVRSILPVQKPEQDLFLLTLNALKNVETQNEYVATIQYILNFLKFSGLQLDFYETDHAYLDINTGNITPEKVENALLIDKKVYSILKSVDGLQNAETSNLNLLKQAVRLLHNVVYLKFGVDVKSFSFI